LRSLTLQNGRSRLLSVSSSPFYYFDLPSPHCSAALVVLDPAKEIDFSPAPAEQQKRSSRPLWVKSGHVQRTSRCPLSAKSGHCHSGLKG
jgi:hypothetical protein